MQDVAIGVFDDGSHWDGQVRVFPMFAVGEIPLSRFAVGGFAVRLVMGVQPCGGWWISHENDVTTVATIAAIGATEWFELFPANGGFPMSTIARGGMHGHMINEL